MNEPSTAMLRQACLIFMDLAYPSGIASIPPKKRAYYELDANRPFRDYLPPSPIATGIAQDLSTRRDSPRAYEFRLGSNHFPHLKLHIQLIEHRSGMVWVFTVDTHDAFSRTSVQPPRDHPDAPQWLALQECNRQLKDRIEEEFEHAGMFTFKSLLRCDLESPLAR